MLNLPQRFIPSGSGKLARVALLSVVVLGIVLGAALMALRYRVLPEIENYHHEVAALVSRAVGLPVTIGRIEADWHGLRPRLVFTDVRLLDGQGQNVLALQRVDNVVSWMTLLSGELRLSALEVESPDIAIRRDQQGVMHIAGVALSAESGDGKLADWLLHQARIVVRNGRVTWQDELYDRPSLVLNQVQFLLENRGARHRFAVRITPPQQVSMPVEVRGDLVGDSLAELSDWHGEMFAQIEAADIRAWENWLTLPEGFSRATGGARAWFEIESGRLKRITADVDMREVQAQLGQEAAPLDITVLHGRLGIQILKQGFEVSTQALSLQMGNGFSLRPTDLLLRLAGGESDRFAAGEVRANVIELAELPVLAEYVPLDTAFRQKLAEFAPRGRITDLRVKWHDDQDKRVRFDVKAHFDAVAVQRVGDFPGIEGLSGQVSGSDNNGVLALDAPGLRLDMPKLFIAPMSFDTLTAQLAWRRSRGEWIVQLNDFSARNADAEASAYGSYQTKADGLGIADITLNLSRASVQSVVRYLPREELGEETMAWLQAGLLAGEADEARLRLRGDLDEFPFPDGHKGVFQVRAKAKDVVIDYAPGWPRVEQARAMLSIDGPRLQVDSDVAMLAGATAQRVQVSIPDMMSEEPVVQVRGEASGETRHGLNFIKRSPVRGYIGGFTDDATARGSGKLDLQLDIPLSEKPVSLKGNYHFVDNEVALGAAIPLARKVSGDLSFTEATLSTDNLQAQILGGPASVAIRTEENGALKVKLQGKADMNVWRKLNPQPLLRSLSGTADWAADIAVAGEQFSIQVDSNLKGLASALPDPLGKPANAVIPLKFELRSAGAVQDVMWLQYGSLINSRMVRQQDKRGVRQITRGYINFGPPRRIVDKSGIWLTGALPALSLDGWGPVLAGGVGTGDEFPPIDGADMIVQRLTGYGNVVNGLNIHARNRDGTITAQLASKEVNGELSWFPQGAGKLVARFKNMTLVEIEKRPADRATPAAGKATEGTVRLQDIPVLDVAIDNLVYQNRPLGKVEFYARQQDKDVLLDHFRVSNPDGMLSVNGKWGDSPAQTHVVIKLELNDVGNMLGRSGYPNSIRNGKGVLDCDLVWAGAPETFSLAKMDGHLNLKMNKGQFLQLDPGAGKLLSVMSLQSLPKRITLDFTDVFSKGFEFDSITGSAQIKQGVLLTDDFKINGSAAAVNLSGQVDLNRETQNLRVRVLPTIGDSVSLLALAAVNPAVGAGVFIANKILSDPLDKLVSFEYNVTGSWLDPKVEKTGQSKAVPK